MVGSATLRSNKGDTPLVDGQSNCNIVKVSATKRREVAVNPAKKVCK